ncbi:MAG TPA: glutathione-regulated potassium-efflux system protein KefC [Ferrovibrio sp.]|uniref:glutathione-regulated potassium-efflux system protein KefC n=1 Tax=Ferrovibrio sp. TaxID=1917215 RepID=UPI002ED50D7B
MDGLLLNAVIYLAAAVIAVPISKRLGFGSVLGYLIAGIVIGPWGLRLIADVDAILHFSEFGVVLLLFVIGLELDPKRLWKMRGPIIGMGTGQVLISAVILAVLFVLAMEWSWQKALIAGLGLSLSSTAIALQPLNERKLLGTPGGRASISILLFQDMAVVPILALLPLLAWGPDAVTAGMDWRDVLKGIAAIAAIVFGGRYLTRPIFRLVAESGLREVFTAVALLLVLSIALLMQFVGLSMALGAFLAGVLLAESEYRHELESDIEPFKGLLLGLFFVAIGMSVDFGLLIDNPGRVLGLTAALLAVKGVVLLLLARVAKIPNSQTALFTFLLAQGGEFAFVLFNSATRIGILDNETMRLLIVAVAISMVLSPLLVLVNDRLIEPRFSRVGERPHDLPADDGNPVIVAGFGRFGQIVARLLYADRIGATILDHDPEIVDTLRQFGFKVFYGDATRLDLLEAAGAAKAKVLVVAVDSVDASLDLIDLAQKHFPHLQIVARARDLPHAIALMDRKVSVIERETFHSALRLGEETLRALGQPAYAARKKALLFKQHNEVLLAEIHAHWNEDINKRITLQQQARARLQQNLEADERAQQEARGLGWD